MKKGTKYKKNNIGITIIILSLLIMLTLISLQSYKSYHDRIKEIRSSAISEFKSKYTITTSLYSNMAQALYKTVIKKVDVTETFYNGINASTLEEENIYREKLLKILTPAYNELINFNFRQLHFHTKDNISFLRFHKPERFGDDLTGFRSSVEYVNREKKEIFGFEEGRIFNGYRFVFPIGYKKEHIGSVELSVSMTAIIKILHDKFHIASEFILDNDIVHQKVFDSELSNYIPWSVDNRFLLDKEIADHFPIDNKFSEASLKILREKLNITDKEPSTIYIDPWKSNTIILLIPIINFEDKVVGYLLSNRNYGELELNRKDFFTTILAIFSLFLMIITFYVYFSFNQRKMKRIANYDFLTSTLMRRTLMERLEIEILNHIRYGNKLSIIMIDIDKFKNINDTLGHKYGDKILKDVSKSMLDNCRLTDSVGRYGGEEFIIILPGTIIKDAIKVAEKVRKDIENTKHDKIKKVTVSCGVAEFTKDDLNSTSFIDLADKNLYKAKQSGRNKTCF